MNAELLKARVVPAILSGTRRDTADPLLSLGSDREHAVLNGLSLGGQLLRFARPPAPRAFALESWPRDERRIVPDRMRSGIVRLLDRCTDDTARAFALALDRQRLRLHPFDLPRLDGFVRRYGEQLGATAQYWSERQNHGQAGRGYFDAEELTAETWADGPLRKRVKFLKELRQRDPGEGRQLLEKTWPSENPDSRIQLVSALRTGLSSQDQPFLENIQKDRAPRVRDAVRRLVRLASGGTGQNPAVAACLERIQKSRTGLLQERVALSLELPATIKEQESGRWIEEQFSGVSLEEFARANELSEAELVEAASQDTHLLFALGLMASRGGRFTLLGTITAAAPDIWGRMSGLNWEESLVEDRRSRQDWAEGLIRPKQWLPEIPFPAWTWLHRQMDGPLPPSVMGEILASPMWAEPLNQEKKGPSLELIQVVCALCPTSLRDSLRERLEPIALEPKDKGMMLLDILDQLESFT